MKVVLFSLLTMVMSTGLWAFSDNVCDDFIPDEQTQAIPHVERDGVCFIDNETDINTLRYDKSKTANILNRLDPNFNVIPLSLGNSLAMLVDSDVLYAMETGNEQTSRSTAAQIEITKAWVNVFTGSNNIGDHMSKSSSSSSSSSSGSKSTSSSSGSSSSSSSSSGSSSSGGKSK